MEWECVDDRCRGCSGASSYVPEACPGRLDVDFAEITGGFTGASMRALSTDRCGQTAHFSKKRLSFLEKRLDAAMLAVRFLSFELLLAMAEAKQMSSVDIKG